MRSPALVHDFLTLSARRSPHKEALIFGEERWTYHALGGASDSLAGTLMGMGLRSGERVALFMDNCAEAVVAFYGTLKAGCVAVPLNGHIKSRKLRYILIDSGAKVLISQKVKDKTVQEAVEGMSADIQIIWIGEEAWIPSSRIVHSHPPPAPPIEGGELKSTALATPVKGKELSSLTPPLAALIYTSGSTGEPKGVMSPHASMIAAARSIIEYLENDSEDIVLNVLPLSFDYGLYQVIMTFMFGGTVILERSFLYPQRVFECIEKERVTGLPVVPTMAALLLRMQVPERFDLSSLRYITSTGAVLPVNHLRRLRESFPCAKLYSMYGLTECKRVSYLPPEQLDLRPESVGMPIPGCEVFVVDEHGNEVKAGEVGELVVRGTNVMGGYWNSPELTERTFRAGRHPGETLLYSGDLFRRDEEGFLYFVGRKDDLVKVKGERVSPREIEDVLYELEGVSEAAVIGIPDEITGGATVAFLVRSKDSRLVERGVLKHCKDSLEPHLVPAYVRFVEEIPKTPQGKIDKEAMKKGLC
jgi:long-chain acyl-CoA synthetase